MFLSVIKMLKHKCAFFVATLPGCSVFRNKSEMHGLDFFPCSLRVYCIQGSLFSNDIGRTMLEISSPLKFYCVSFGIVEKMILWFYVSFQYLSSCKVKNMDY